MKVCHPSVADEDDDHKDDDDGYAMSPEHVKKFLTQEAR